MAGNEATKKQNEAIELSIVIPCFNSSKALPDLNERLNKVLFNLQVKYEIIYVNDASLDDTKEIMKKLALNNDSIVAIDLMANVGQIRALICGLEYTRGNYVVTMDDDLQHPPEEIGKLYRELKSNSELDAVIGVYMKKEHSRIRNLGSYSAQKLRALLMNRNYALQTTSFRCMTRALTKTIIENKAAFPAINLIIFQSTDNIKNIEVVHHQRKHGKSNYSYFDLVKIFITHLFNSTNIPLRIIRYSGLIIFAVGIVLFLYYLTGQFMGSLLLSEGRALIILVNVYTGLLLLSIGIVGEYFFKVLQEVNRPPRFTVREIYRKKK